MEYSGDIEIVANKGLYVNKKDTVSFYTALMLLKLLPRAQVVARYLLGGWNTESIAAQMGISPVTVNYAYCEQIRKATGQPTTFKAVMAILHDERAMHYLFDMRP